MGFVGDSMLRPARAHGLGIILGTSLLCLGVTVLTLSQILKPSGKKRGRSGQKPKLPPGPRGIPILGNLLQIGFARQDPELKFYKNLATEYGELATVHAGSNTWIVLNSNRVVSEFIAKRNTVTSDRFDMPVANDIVGYGNRTLLMRQDKWIEPRRVMHGLLSGTALKQYGEWQELESTQMLAEYLLLPKYWYKHHYRYANSVIHRIVLGQRLKRTTQDLEDLQNCVTYFLRSIGGSLVDAFPVIGSIPKPLQFWRPHWEKTGLWARNVFASWWDPVFDQVSAGVAPPSFVRDVLLNPETRYSGDREEAMYVALSLISAGSDTTRQALNVMVMCALENPQAIAKARAEIDALCGTGSAARLPVMTDMDDLRYICAMAKELLRWRPLFPLGLAHVSTQDIEFEGYFIPAGVGFVINGLPIANDCENPESFMPERWLDGHETDIAHGQWQFGGGRRVCVGYRLAQRNLFINIARLIQCFDFQPNGPYDSRYLNHASTDEPFPVSVCVRSEDYEILIRSEATKVEVLEDARGIIEKA